MNVIAVDDELPNLNSIKNIIEKQTSQKVNVFQFSDEAILFAKKNDVDIAFLDIAMPETNGIELAKILRKKNPCVNIIFTTGYREYGAEAFDVEASDYILKPVTEAAVKKSFSRLRFPLPLSENKIAAKKGIAALTFCPSLKLFCNGKEIRFARKKSRELLALLIDRCGKPMERHEIFNIIFEEKDYSRPNQDYLQKIIADLRDTLKANSAEKILFVNKNSYSVDKTKFYCDLYESKRTFNGEYLTEYSWAENTLALLTRELSEKNANIYAGSWEGV